MAPVIANRAEARPDRSRISANAAGLSRTGSGNSSVFVVVCGVLVIVGWIGGFHALRILFISPVAMKINTALAFVLTGLSLWLIQDNRVTSSRRFISKSLALAAALMGFMTLLEFLLNLDIGIDQALIYDIPNAPLTSNPGRMSPITAVEFVLIGSALFLIDIETRGRLRPSQFIAIASLGIAFFNLLGYIYGMEILVGLSIHFTVIALHTLIIFIAASLGILLALPDKGIMLFFIKESPGSHMARRLFAAIFIAPIVIDILLISGQNAGFYGHAYTSAFHAVIVIIIMVALLLQTARYMNRLDDMKRTLEEERESVARFPEENPDPTIRLCHDLDVIYSNRASKPLLHHLGFQENGGHWTAAKDIWQDTIVGALDSGAVSIVEMPVDEQVFALTVTPMQDMSYVNLYGHDVTELKSAQKALNYERTKLQNILDSMQDCIVLVRCDLMVEYANDAAVRDFGPFEGIKCYTYLNGMNEHCSWCASDKVFLGESVRRDFISHLNKKTYDVIETPITNIDGSISRLGIFRDISARKHIENELLLFSQAIEETIDTVHIIDTAGKIIYANKAAAAMTGYSFKESLGMDVINLVADKSFAVNVIIPAIYVRGSWEGEILCEKKDGATYMGWLAASLVNNPDGKPVAMIGTLRDITVRKEIEDACRAAEANMKALVNAITESVCLVDTNGVFITVNDTFARRFSTDTHRSAIDIVGTNFKDLLTPDVFTTKKGYIEEVISTGLPVTFENTRGDFMCLTNMYPVFDDECRVSGVAIYASDITLRKKYENYLLTSIKEKELLMREIHHRVKNNLQIVAGLIGLQLNLISDERYKAMFNETRNRIKSIALVHDKLYGSKGLAEVDLKQYILSLANDLFSSFGIDRQCVALTLVMDNVIIGID
ncbi:MAG: PAS domain S-box protein, partial [Nitrospirae bacterium]|nr:PAS domain S-box protein [Nitrospirota bacterium]